MNREPISSGKIYLYKNNSQFGPYNESEVMELLQSNQFTLNNLACREGMSEWKPLGAILQNTNHALPYIPPHAPTPNWLSQVSLTEGGLFAGVFCSIVIFGALVMSMIAQTLVFPGPLVWILASAVAGWAVSQRLRKKMGQALGREIRTDMELTSISNWMEIASKGDKSNQK